VHDTAAEREGAGDVQDTTKSPYTVGAEFFCEADTGKTEKAVGEGR
jgi:hypothetical protein